jgi:hypothetical protein
MISVMFITAKGELLLLTMGLRRWRGRVVTKREIPTPLRINPGPPAFSQSLYILT